MTGVNKSQPMPVSLSATADALRTLSMQEKYLNAINLFGKFGPQRLAQVRRVVPSFQAIWEADRATLLKSGLAEDLIDEFLNFRATQDMFAEWQKLEGDNIRLVSLDDPDYPASLKEIYHPPVGLYVRGTLPPPNQPLLGLVGSRHATAYGEQITRELAAALSQSGVVVVSGLAYGVDTVAHKAAVDAEKPTIAVLGCGIDHNSIYPRSNTTLTQQIMATGGAIISEYPIATLPFKQHFPYRNRIIAGLSLGVLVTEASEDSGSLLTARHALDQNREVFAVPGSIYNKLSEGTNNLIKMGAHCVTKIDDILDVLNLSELRHLTADSPIIPDTYEESLILPHLSKEPVHVDAIVIKSKLATPTVNATLTLMEMKGKVRNIGGMMYVKTR